MRKASNDSLYDDKNLERDDSIVKDILGQYDVEMVHW